MTAEIQVPEGQKTNVKGIDKEKDLPYLREKFLSRAPGLDLFWDESGRPWMRNPSYSGVIETDGVRLICSTKVKTNLFYMLNFLRSQEGMVFDPQRAIDIQEGEVFFDVLGRLFLNEAEEIIRKGLIRKYMPREENQQFLKGKLLVSEQIRRSLIVKPNFFCRYYDLTCDVAENKILLAALHSLVPKIRYNEELKGHLLRAQRRILEEVSLSNGISPSDCDNVCFDRLNERYKTAIEFSKLILEETFVRSTGPGISKGFNFIVNMWKVYEDFVTEMIAEVVEEDPAFSDYKVVPHESLHSLVKEGNILTKPDILIKDRRTGEYPLILDAKYKKDEANSDFYQMAAYSLAVPKARKCCLLYPDAEGRDENEYTILRNVFDPLSGELKLHTKRLRVFEENGAEFGEFVKNFKSRQVRPMLLDLLNLPSTGQPP